MYVPQPVSIGTFDVVEEGQQGRVASCPTIGDYDGDIEDAFVDPDLLDDFQTTEDILHGKSNEGRPMTLQQIFLE